MRITRTATLFMMALGTALLTLVPTAAAGDPKSIPVSPSLSDDDAAYFSSLIGNGSIACNLGFPGPPLMPSAYLYEEDEYYTLLLPSQCPACAGTDAVRLIRAYTAMTFRTVCRVTLEYSIVPNIGTEACPFPDREAEVCASKILDYVAPAASAQIIVLDLPDSCQFRGSAFLKVKIVDFSPECNNPDPNTGSTPLVYLLATCSPCASYEFVSEVEDLCMPPISLQGNPMMWAEAWSCFVPNLHRSWGSLKIRYR